MELCPRNFSDGSEETISSQDEEKHYGESPEDNRRCTIELKTKSYHQNGNNKMVTFSTKQKLSNKMSRVSEEVTEDIVKEVEANNESATTGQNSCNGTPPMVNNGYESSPQFLTLAETKL